PADRAAAPPAPDLVLPARAPAGAGHEGAVVARLVAGRIRRRRRARDVFERDTQSSGRLGALVPIHRDRPRARLSLHRRSRPGARVVTATAGARSLELRAALRDGAVRGPPA